MGTGSCQWLLIGSGQKHSLALSQAAFQGLCLSLPPTSPLIAICSVISFSNTAEHGEAAAWEPGREEGKRAPVPCSESAGPALCPVSCPCMRACVCVCVYPEPDRHEHVVIQPTTRPLQGQTRASTCTRHLAVIIHLILATTLITVGVITQFEARAQRIGFTCSRSHQENGAGSCFHLGLFDCWAPSPSHETFSPFGF